MWKQIDDVQNKVEEVLKEVPVTRASDKHLFWEVARRFYGATDTMTRDQFLNMPPSESIRRSRQLLQQEGFYKPNDQVLRQRKEEEERVRRKLSGQMELL